jgi:proteic killer suppression protein
MEYRCLKNKLQKQISNASEIKRAFGTRAKNVSLRLDEIKAADNMAVLKSIPTANLHPLTANRNGQWAIDVSRNFRMVLEIDQDPIPIDIEGIIILEEVIKVLIIEIVDYH